MNVFGLSVVIAGVSIFFIDNARWIGIVLICLAVLCIVTLIPFRIKIKTVYPDIVFGIIDNGILAVCTVFGAHFAGVAGAIWGGVVGNAITDGIAGVFEGHTAEKLRLNSVSEERTMLKSAVGKMAGCLLGAGVVLAVAGFFQF